MSPRRWLAAVAGVLLLASGTSGCLLQMLEDDGEALPEVSWSPPPGTPDRVETGAERRTLAQAILDRRAAALREGKLADFVVDLDRSDPEFLAEQKRLFDNLQQLPLQVFDYEVEKDEWNTIFADDQWESQAYIPFVRQRIQLRGFDRFPVETVFGVTFHERGDGLRIVSDTDVAERTADGSQEAPWDLTELEVVRGERVLGIFDEGSADRAQDVMSAAERSIDIVSRSLPVRWDKSVVLYVLSDKTALSRLGGIPGGDVDSIGGISFAVYADAERSGRVASTRVFVHPDYIEYIQPDRDLLLTHEITHVAVAKTAGGGPVWVQEGLAEYVATDGADSSYLHLDRDLVERAAEGTSEMPSSAKFNTVDQPWHYNMALMACDYIAEEHGEDDLWEVYLAMQKNTHVTTDQEQNRVLRDAIGINAAELARQAARHMVESSPYAELYPAG